MKDIEKNDVQFRSQANTSVYLDLKKKRMISLIQYLDRDSGSGYLKSFTLERVLKYVRRK